MNRKLFLFDIDGTILSPGILPRRILNKAFFDLAGASPDLQFEDVAGLTDPLIITNGLRKLGITDGVIPKLAVAILERYLTNMERDYPQSDLPVLYRDALDFLDAVQDERHVTALLTGNVEAGAKIKLDRFGLFERFAFGAYGDDSADRTRLPGVARVRAREVLGTEFRFEDLIIVGDTPNDARVAALAGARSVIVCRRPEWEQEIWQAGADLVVPSLSDTDNLLKNIADF
ncbi:MAG: haloacid dehalogenase-like hydrolase [Candidatus Marinimicrobia bacterium]|nr:haloacid dehalogenase-like hydrolase [Candidatus Neomarinimicrobiota bacterium]